MAEWLFNQILNGFLTSACVIFGSVGNIHSIKSVHFANFDKNRGVVLAVSILALAIWDTILLWCAFFYYGLKSLTQAPRGDLFNLLTPYFHAFSQIANTASIWCVVSITIQRYMATRDPFRTSRSNRVLLHNSFHNSIDRRKTSMNFLVYCAIYRRHFRPPVILSIVAILVNIPAFFEIVTRICYRMDENRHGYGLYISALRLNEYYKLWYKVVFRMLITSCGPNIFILLLTVLTVLLLKGSNRSRRQLFQMSETMIDKYTTKETMQTMISLMLVIKFLLFRSLSFMLDIWEVTVGFGDKLHIYIYLVDISNFLVLLNSATNCLIFLRGSTWLQQKIVERTSMKRKRQLCIDRINSIKRVNLLFKSYHSALYMTNRQLGVRLLYSMLIKNPQMMTMFNQLPRIPTPKLSCGSSCGSLHLSCATDSIVSDGPSGEGDEEKSPAPYRKLSTPTPARKSSGSDGCPYKSIMMQAGSSPSLQVLKLPPVKKNGVFGNAEFVATAMSVNRAAEIVSVLPRIKKGSRDMLANPKFHEVGDRIMNFIGELIELMRKNTSDQYIIMKIRKVGAIHHQLGIVFSSGAWKEFKSAMLCIISECEFANDMEKAQTLEAWSSFISVIIREMKMGMWGSSLERSPLLKI
uniref:G-protein coupled receptors family 1 profile domain-containing protein n=1 Tax=Acrobeloides nanus TaxID=290746 RepID=A0A914DI34_9BILA